MGNTNSTLQGSEDTSLPEENLDQRAFKFPAAPGQSPSASSTKAARSDSERPHVTVHGPGHLYSHSISLPVCESPSEEQGEAKRRPRPQDRWSSGGYRDVALRAGSSDLSLTLGRISPSHSDAGSLITSGSRHTSSSSDIGSVAEAPLLQPPPPANLAPIQADIEPSDVEPAIPTPRASDAADPRTPRQGGQQLENEDTRSTPHVSKSVSRFPGPERASPPSPRAMRHTSLIFGAEHTQVAPHDLPSVDETSSVFESASGASEAMHPSDARIHKLPSYLRIPTAIPSSYQSDTPAGEGGVPLPPAEFKPAPGSGKASTAVQYDNAFANARERNDTSSFEAHADAVPVREIPAPALADMAQDALQPSDASLLTPVNLSWHGRGRKVFVTGTFANNWRSKITLRQIRVGGPFVCTLHLPPGTHRLKFIIDDRWRVSNELNTATDGEGNLVNYVEIPRLPMPTQILEHTRRGGTPLELGVPKKNRHKADRAASPAHADPVADDPRYADPTWSRAMAELHDTGSAAPGGWEDELGDDGKAEADDHWTTDVPRAIELAQETEEALQQSELPPDQASIMPNPPMLPRQLEKVIMNSSPANANGHINAPISVVDDNSVLPAPNHALLNHLAASAIKNGVLAVGTVTRYKRKYVTTLLYRPVKP